MWWRWKIHVLPGSSKRKRRGDNPQRTTIMSHGVACYSRGAELASSSAADKHLFWHFLSTLTQKTHDNATLCISKVQSVWRSPFTFPFLVPLIPKATFLTVWKGRKLWRSPIDVRRDGQKASHVVTIKKQHKNRDRYTKICRIAGHQYLP